jgi:ATP adenylyltransferase
MVDQQIFAPWRMTYIRELEGQGAQPDADACFLCDAAAVQPGGGDADVQLAQRLVLHSEDRGLILLNRFPYTTGHLLIAPREHAAELTDLSAAQRAGLIELVALAQTLVRTAYNPQGMNIGMNLGRCAGAGLPGHLHVHVVPRWGGDTNFLSVVGQVRVIPQSLDESHRLLRDALARVLDAE